MQFRSSCTAPRLFCIAAFNAYIGSVIRVCFKKGFKNMLLPIIRYLQSWNQYGKAIQELSQLSDRELADIGLTRGDIPRIAWEHAAGDQQRRCEAAQAALPGGGGALHPQG
jgi:uncharacterized protein YjiS (DUF1127 family)